MARPQTDEIGRIDAQLKTLTEQETQQMEERLEMLAGQMPEDEEPLNTTVVEMMGAAPVITPGSTEADFLRAWIISIRNLVIRYLNWNVFISRA